MPGTPGTPCQAKPPGDHLGCYLAAVLRELVVITDSTIVRDGAR